MTTVLYLKSRVPGGLWIIGKWWWATTWLLYKSWASPAFRTFWYEHVVFPFWVGWLVEVDKGAEG